MNAIAPEAATFAIGPADKPELVDRVTRSTADGLREVELHIGDMRCTSCAERIRAALGAVRGVRTVKLNPARRVASVTYDPRRAALSSVVVAVERAGYTPAFAGVEADDPAARSARRRALKRLGVAGIAMMQTMMYAAGSYAGAFDGISPFYESLMRWSGLIFALPVVLYSATPFFVDAASSVRLIGSPTNQAGLTMDVPVALAIGIAFAVSVYATIAGTGDVYFDSVTMFTFFLLVARYLEQTALHRSMRFDHWLSMMPEYAQRIGAGGPERVTLAQIATNDRLIVAPGSRIPADGAVDDGVAQIDEAALTGESVPVVKERGAGVFAGTMNVGQAFSMVVGNVRSGTRIAAIQRLATRATLERPAIVSLADRLAHRFVASVLVLAAATAAVWFLVDSGRALPATIAVLVVSCPCALALAVPAAVAAATMALRRRGFVVTRSDVLERLAGADVVIFDKTGTLTNGHPELVSTNSIAGLDTARSVALAAALEQGAEHPLQRAFSTAAVGVDVPVASEVHAHAGAGIEGTIDGQVFRLGHAEFCGIAPRQCSGTDTRVYLASSGTELAEFRLRDAVRDDACATVRALKRIGLHVEGLSGDGPEPCSAAGQMLGIDVHARVSPEAKLEHVRRLTREGRRVVMVGDGLNDVPGLAAACVSVAPADATELACSTSDALLLSRGIAPLADAFAVARRTRGVMRQNLAWAFGYNIVCIPLAALGLLPAWLAALGMSTSSLLVTLNALRLAR